MGIFLEDQKMNNRLPPLPPQPQLPQEFTKGLPYEIDQLRGCYDRLIASSGQSDVVIHNALVESFATHARNLAEFFLGKRNAMDPKRFTASSYSPDRSSADALYKQICVQISHLQEGGRATTDAEKFNATAPEVISLLETEIKHFTDSLRPEIKTAFKCETQPATVAALPTASATNAFSSTTLAHKP
jgi:hypothetical protein